MSSRLLKNVFEAAGARQKHFKSELCRRTGVCGIAESLLRAMVSTVRLPLVQRWVLVTALLQVTACTSFLPRQPEAETAVDPGREEVLQLLRNQQALLTDYSTRLATLSESQNQMAASITDMGSQLSAVQSKMDEEKAEIVTVVEQPEQPVKTATAIVPAQTVAEKISLGRVEWVYVDVIGRPLKARVDTGAKVSSLSAEGIQRFERDGERWVRFYLPGDDEKKRFEVPMTRMAKIKNPEENDSDVRPTVKLVVQVGEVVEETEFTLTDRSDLNYPVSLGRSFLQDVFIVDVAKVFSIPKEQLLEAVEAR